MNATATIPARSGRPQRTPAHRPARLARLALVWALLALCLAVPPTASAEPRAGPHGDPHAPGARHGETCRYYANRARFEPRKARVGFVVLLAEGCVAARGSLATGAAPERQAAAVLLERLAALREVVIAINVARVYGPDAGPRDKPLHRPGEFATLGGVSASGEYLIAQRLGLIRAFEDWRAFAEGFSLALE